MKVVCDWLYSFTTYIELEVEENDSLNKLRQMIDNERSNDKISNMLIDFTIQYITAGFEDQLYRLCFRHYMYNYGGGTGDNCFSESSNSVMSRDVLGPKPKHRLHVAADCIIEHSEECNRKLYASAIEELNTLKIRKKNETEADKVARVLSKTIIETKNDMAMNQYGLSKDYWSIEVNHINGKFVLLTSSRTSTKRLFLLRKNDMRTHEVDHCRPIYDRTRLIVAEEVLVSGVTYVCLTCSCGHMYRGRSGCRHMYSILDRYPIVSDFFPCCFKTYELKYGRDAQYTAQCDNVTQRMKESGGLLARISLSTINTKEGSIQDLTFYLRAYQRIIDKNPNSIDLICEDEGDEYGGHHSSLDFAEVSSRLRTRSKSKGNKEAYAMNMPMYSTICENIRSKEQQDFLARNLNDILSGVMRMGVAATARPGPGTSRSPGTGTSSTSELITNEITNEITECSNDGESGLASLSQIEWRSSNKRKAPSGSPSKYKSH